MSYYLSNSLLQLISPHLSISRSRNADFISNKREGWSVRIRILRWAAIEREPIFIGVEGRKDGWARGKARKGDGSASSGNVRALHRQFGER